MRILSRTASKKTIRSMKDEKEYHRCYLRAVNNPKRREILKALTDGYITLQKLQSKIGLDKKDLEWHLDVLENGSCVRKEIIGSKTFYRITKEGLVIDYLNITKD